MERESNYDNDGLDLSEEYFRKKKKVNDEETYFSFRRIRTASLLKGLVNLLKDNWQIKFWIFKIYEGVDFN